MLDHFFPLLFPKDSESLKILDIGLWKVGAKRPLNGTSKVKKVREKNLKKIAQRFLTIFKQKCSNMRQLLYITFPQGFRISKSIGHPTLGSGGKKNHRPRGPMIGKFHGKGTNRHTNRQTHKHTDSVTTRPTRPRGPSW